MPIYEFSCAHCGTFDRSFAMADVPDACACAGCDAESRRLVSAPGLGHGHSAAMSLLDSTARSAHDPSVVSSVPSGAGRSSSTSRNPLHSKLPRP